MLLESFPELSQLSEANSYLCFSSESCLFTPNFWKRILDPFISRELLVCLSFRGSSFGDAECLMINQLWRLEILDLSFSKVTDIGIGHLARSVNAHNRYKSLDFENLSDTTGLGRLRSLDLECTQVTRKSLSCFECFPNLQALNLTRSLITKAQVNQVLVNKMGWSFKNGPGLSQELIKDSIGRCMSRRDSFSDMVESYISKLNGEIRNDLLDWCTAKEDSSFYLPVRRHLIVPKHLELKPPIYLIRNLSMAFSNVQKNETRRIEMMKRPRIESLSVKQDTYNPFAVISKKLKNEPQML